ncbi:MAG: hypothetical protein ABIF85_04350 [Nanoarchaeota archaeon]|nr:hypothetical protein [Nanoarchaeota archaeon]MBU4300632.1 hypothetical protein [Nanoarchaeota archaeon]MBU4452011.1 hypothetical protein [Nanoarchaeota archaeon]MCG2724225.1 hypothetical protein [archaeon]
MKYSETKQIKLSRPKLFSILSLFSAIAAGYYFIDAQLLEAIAFTAIASIFDSAGIGAETAKQKNWHPPLKNALDRTADAAIFIGFAMSGTVSEMWGAIALVLVIVLPYWAKLIWKISIRRFFHAALIARVVYFLVYGV